MSVKEVMLTVFWDMKEPVTIDFLEKGAPVNNISYCQHFWENLPYLLNDPCITDVQINSVENRPSYLGTYFDKPAVVLFFILDLTLLINCFYKLSDVRILFSLNRMTVSHVPIFIFTLSGFFLFVKSRTYLVSFKGEKKSTHMKKRPHGLIHRLSKALKLVDWILHSDNIKKIKLIDISNAFFLFSLSLSLSLSIYLSIYLFFFAKNMYLHVEPKCKELNINHWLLKTDKTGSNTVLTWWKINKKKIFFALPEIVLLRSD